MRKEIKETIEFLCFVRDTLKDGYTVEEWLKVVNFKGKIKKIISLLQQGEAYRQIVRDVKIMLLPGYFLDHAPELERFRGLFKETEQKYFPKEAKQNEDNPKR